MIVQDWLNGLATREKLLVGTAAVVAALAIIVIGVVRPLSASRASLAEQISEKRAVLADIERVAARFGPNASARLGRASPSGESLVVLIDRTARSSGLGAYLRRNEPDGNASIRLRFENVSFDELASWLVELKVTQGIAVTAASTDPAQDAGRVNATLQLSRSATP
jgi:general secretion pathway protein M